MNNETMQYIEKVSEWVFITCGIEGMIEMTTDEGLEKYMDAYNESMMEFSQKLQNSPDAMNALAESVYNEIKNEIA